MKNLPSQSKVLARILKRSLGIKNLDDLADFLCETKHWTSSNSKRKDLAESFQDMIDLLEKAFIDLDRVIDIRDRSLSVSSTEMLQLNDEIQVGTRAQAATLNSLREIISVFSPENTATDEQNSLSNLVSEVQILVQANLNAAKNLKHLFAEGRNISAVMKLSSLNNQIFSSVRHLSNIDCMINMYFSSRLMSDEIAKDFYMVNETDLPMEYNRLSTLGAKNAQKIPVKSPKSGLILAYIVVTCDMAGSDFVRIEENIFGLLANVATTIENIDLLRKEKLKQHLESELETAKVVQQALLPPAILGKDNDILISGYYESATECGGDWWGQFKTKDDKHFVLLGDVTGHGTGSAMISAVVKGYADGLFENEALNTQIVLERMNRIMYETGRPGNHLMTMAAVEIDVKNEELWYCNAGHPPPILIEGSSPEGEIRYLMSAGLVLGNESNSQFEMQRYKFTRGDKLFIYSDGLTECYNRDNKMFGDRRLVRSLEALNKDIKAWDLNKSVIEAVQKFSMGEPLKDDITAVVIEFQMKDYEDVETDLDDDTLAC